MQRIRHYQTKLVVAKYVFLSIGLGILIVIMGILYNEHKVSLPINSMKSLSTISKYPFDITNAVITGLDDHMAPYQLFVKSMGRDKENHYILNDVRGTYAIDKDSNMLIQSKHGILDNNAKQLHLLNGVNITFNTITLATKALDLNLQTKDIYSTVPVVINFNNSTIQAQSFNAKAATGVVTMTGGVISQFNLGDLHK